MKKPFTFHVFYHYKQNVCRTFPAGFSQFFDQQLSMISPVRWRKKRFAGLVLILHKTPIGNMIESKQCGLETPFRALDGISGSG